MAISAHTIHIDIVQDNTVTAVLGAESELDGRTARVEIKWALDEDPLMAAAITQLSELITADAAKILGGVTVNG